MIDRFIEWDFYMHVKYPFGWPATELILTITLGVAFAWAMFGR